MTSKNTVKYAFLLPAGLGLALTSCPKGTLGAGNSSLVISGISNDATVSGTLNPGPGATVNGFEAQQVTFEVRDRAGKLISSKSDGKPRFCMEGGDTNCAAFDTKRLADGDYTLIGSATSKDAVGSTSASRRRSRRAPS